MNFQLNKWRIGSLICWSVLSFSCYAVNGQSCPKHYSGFNIKDSVIGYNGYPSTGPAPSRFSKPFTATGISDTGWNCFFDYLRYPLPAFDPLDTVSKFSGPKLSSLNETDSSTEKSYWTFHCVLRPWDFDDDYLDSPATPWKHGIPVAVCSWGFRADSVKAINKIKVNDSDQPILKMYPNPSRSYVNFESEGATTIIISDPFGKHILEFTTQGIYQLDVSELAKGIYTVLDLKKGKVQFLVVE